MLMARPTGDGHVRSGPIPSPITLPSFESFCAIAGQADQALPPSARRPSSTTEPAVFSRSSTLTSPRRQTSYRQHPYSPHQIEQRQPVPFTQPHNFAPLPAPSQWNFSTHDSATASIHLGRPPYLESFSPPQTQLDPQPHAKVVIQERVVDGKGLCYIYNDGTSCPKLINGDTVNPKWGTTKAGKPRKRLGQACNTCREKKIRCDPQVLKCAQCQKFGRECKFETSARGSQRSVRGQSTEDSSPPSERRGSIQLDRPSTSESFDTFHERGISKSSIGDLLSPKPAAPGSPPSLPLNKKRKHSSSSNPTAPEISMHSPHQVMPNFGPTTNPFAVDGHLAQYYFGAFMDHFNATHHHIFPDQRFRAWAYSDMHKGRSDILLIYAVLAVGTVVCSQRNSPRTADDARVFLQTMEQALEHETARPTFQLAQTLLLLSYYRLAKGEIHLAREASSFAMNVCTKIGLNYESHRDGDAVQLHPCFGLDKDTFDECRRRTFWVAYIQDSSMHYCAPQDELITDVCCTLRIPCAERSYDAGSIALQPMANFQGFDSHEIPFSPTMGRMAVFVEGFAILRETLSWIARFRRMSIPETARLQVDVQQRLLQRAERFYAYICEIDPRKRESKAHYSEARADASVQKQEPREAFIVYHLIKMVLYRHVRHACMTSEQIAANVTKARSEAFGLLNLLWKLRDNGHEITSCPVAGDAVFLAIDITTAGDSVASALEVSAEEGGDDLRHERTGTGSRKAFTELLASGTEVLDAFSSYWGTAKQQVDTVFQRFTAIRMVCNNAMRKPGYFFRQPLYSPFGREMDVIYGLEKVALFTALGMGDRIRSEDDLYEARG